MKKIILFALTMLLIVAALLSQNIGFNGAGFFENRTPQSDQWLKDLNQDFTIRVPGGPIAKFADPYSNEFGWGITHDAVDSIQIKYGSDDEEETADALAKWHKKVNEQPQHSYLDELIELQKMFPRMRVIWVANVFIDPERTVDAIQYLLLHGVNIVSVEMGNETYGQLNFDFQKYIRLAEPLETTLKFNFGIPISHISANNKTRAQLNWNTALAAWMPAGDLITIHYYIVQGEMTADEILNFDVDFSYWFQTFTNAGDFIITEANIKPSAWVGNTWLNAAYIFKLLNAHQGEFLDLCIQSGVTPDRYGIIFNEKKGPGQIRNTTYYAFDLFGSGEEYFVNTGEGYPVKGKAVFYTADSLLSSSMHYAEGSFIPKYSFGYIIPEYRDTIICHDSIYLAGYRDSTIYIPTVDTIMRDECIQCDNHWYKFTHRFRCKLCKILGDTEIIYGTREDTIKIPVYKSVEVCETKRINSF